MANLAPGKGQPLESPSTPCLEAKWDTSQKVFRLSPALGLCFNLRLGEMTYWSFSGHPTPEAFPGSSSLQVVRVSTMGAAGLSLNSEEGGQEGCDK